MLSLSLPLKFLHSHTNSHKTPEIWALKNSKLLVCKAVWEFDRKANRLGEHPVRVSTLSHIRLESNSIVTLIKPCPRVTIDMSCVSVLIYLRQQNADTHEKNKMTQRGKKGTTHRLFDCRKIWRCTQQSDMAKGTELSTLWSQPHPQHPPHTQTHMLHRDTPYTSLMFSFISASVFERDT